MLNKQILSVILAAVLSVGIIWMPFLLKVEKFWGIEFGQANMQTIVSNFDGINFLIVAKTMYDPAVIEIDYPSILSGRENLYFSAHYPGFPLLIKFFDIFLSGPNALLLAILASNMLLAIALYYFFQLVSGKRKLAVFITLLALFIPARMLSMRSVGSNETLFIPLVLGSLIMASKEKHALAAILGSLAVLTRSPGILLFGAYMLPLVLDIWKKRKVIWGNYLPYLLIPATLLSLWFYYGLVFGDFLAYFKVGGNINLHWPPFSVFGSNFDWVSGMWLEDIIYTFVFYSIGVFLFFDKQVRDNPNQKVIGYFALIYLTTIFFVVHRDIARYSLPIAPIVIAGYSHLLESKFFKYGLVIISVPIFLYAWNFILNNVQPIMDWSAYL